MGSQPDQFDGLGRGGRVALPGSGKPGGRLAQLHGRGRLGHVAAPDPAFRTPFAVRTISLALVRMDPTWGSAAACMRAADGFLAALTWLSSGVVPGVWLVLTGWSPELVPDPDGNAPHARTNAWPWPWPWSTRKSAALPAVRAVIATESVPCAAPLDLARLAARLESGEQITPDHRDR